MRVLLVKMSSLGDVIHALPGVTDAARNGVRFDWVVEEAFADIPGRHPAVEHVLPIAWRRWRSSLWSARGEMRAFRKALRAHHYDLVLDSQGLVKSAAVTRMARAAERAGYDAGSAREGLAARAYTRHFEVARGAHAVDRQRALFAAALGYEIAGEADFGLGGAGPARVEPHSPRDVVFLHGTTWENKEWPEPFWARLAQLCLASGCRVRLLWGNEIEKTRADRLAALDDVEVLPRMPLAQVMDVLSGAAAVVGVDSGLTHLAGALGRPTAGLYGATDASLTGARGPAVVNLSSTLACAPCVRRVCSYAGSPPEYEGRRVEPACFASVPPERVWQTVLELMDADRVLHF